MTGLAPERDREHSIGDQLRALNVGFMERLLHRHELKGFHELRAAYACERYKQLTGYTAPVIRGKECRIDRYLDQRARQQISLELGHDRSDVILAYIGSLK